jgi:hypothetical protein
VNHPVTILFLCFFSSIIEWREPGHLITVLIAAMRLRQLRTTQSVTFFAPPEVDQSIKDFCHSAKNERLNSSQVVSWLLEQTCRANEDLNKLYVTQGIDFCQRTDAVWRHREFENNKTHRARLLAVLRRPERQTLEQMYGGALVASDSVGPMSVRKLQVFANQLTKSTDTRGNIPTNALEEVEQEREVQVQVEQVRQVQKPPRYKPLLFPGMHPTIASFVRTGVLETKPSGGDAPGFEHAFAVVARTNLGRRFNVRETGSNLFVSREFGKTVKFAKDANVADNFLVSFRFRFTMTFCDQYVKLVDTDNDGLIAPCGMDPLESIDSDRADHYTRGG